MKKLIKGIRDVYNDGELRESEYRFNDWLLLESEYCDSNLYESFIHPVITFIHDCKIEPTGWITADTNNKYVTDLYNNEEYSCNWTDIKEHVCNETSNFVVASFDIECDSSHGDFPLAKKDMRKLAQTIYDTYREYVKNIPYKFMNNFLEKDRYILVMEIIMKSLG